MELSKVTIEDGKQCASLIKALSVARFADVSTQDLEAVVAAKRWLQGVALKMAEQLKDSQKPAKVEEPAAAPAMKIKAMGPIGASAGKRKKK